MGVPGLYRYLVNRYPLFRRRMGDLSNPIIHNFYIDFNCIIYNALKVVSLTDSNQYENLFIEIFRYLDLLVQSIRPENLLFIAVDGPAPLAKCAQQRSRRFVAGRDFVPGSFSTVNISVGTEFMENLHQRLLEFITDRISNDPIWNQPKIIYSGHRTPGEGEHKFFNYIRQQQAEGIWNSDLSHCVYSPDADLIFLCLQTKEKYFYIMKEWDSWMFNDMVGNAKKDHFKCKENDFELLHLPILRDYLILDFPEIDINNLVSDFVAISFLIGNDFIPHFPEIDIHFGHFSSILESYQVSLLERKIFLVQDGSFNKEALRDFLITVTNSVAREQRGKKSNRLDTTSIESARKYIKSKYPDNESLLDLEKDLCYSVIDSFNWVLQYYSVGCPSWVWCFPYHYAPPLVLVTEYILEHDSIFDLNRPPLPFEQLLSILPPSMSSLLPPSISGLMFSPSPISDLYPPNFKIDLNGRIMEHEGVVLIPIIDIFRIRDALSDHQSLTSEEEKRNIHEGDYILKESSTCPITAIHIRTVPRLTDIQHFELLHYDLRVFDRSTQEPSYRMTPKQTAPSVSKLDELIGLINTDVWIGWPFFHLAKVIGVFDQTNIIVKGADNIDQKSNCPDRYKDMIHFYLTRMGVFFDESRYGLVVQPYVIGKLGGKISRAGFSVNYPLEYHYHLKDPSMIPLLQRRKYPSATPLDVNSTVILCDRIHNGQVANIKDIDESQVILQLTPPIHIDSGFIKSEGYPLSFDAISEEIGISIDVLRQMLSSVPVRGYKGDYAFTMFSKYLVLDGISFEENGDYFFINDVIHYIRQYLDFTNLHHFYANNPLDDKGHVLLSIEKLAKGKAEQQRIMEDLASWMKTESPLSGIPLLISHNKMASYPATKKFELRLIKSNLPNLTSEMISIPKEQFKYITHYSPNSNTTLALGDRIIYASNIGLVPFGTYGTVIGFNQDARIAYIIADKELKYGSLLRNKLTTPRGFVARFEDVFILQ